MKELGLELFTPPGPRSGIVTCVVDDGQAVGQLLKENIDQLICVLEVGL